MLDCEFEIQFQCADEAFHPSFKVLKCRLSAAMEAQFSEKPLLYVIQMACLPHYVVFKLDCVVNSKCIPTMLSYSALKAFETNSAHVIVRETILSKCATNVCVFMCLLFF